MQKKRLGLDMKEVMSYIDEHLNTAIEDVIRLCRFATVAAKKQDIVETADAVEGLLESVGLETVVHEIQGSPVITGWMDNGGSRTLMFYDHYDVQPAEPFDLWDSPPFEPEIRNGRIYGRGTCDNKGDIVSRVWALKAFLETNTDIPVNIKFIVEGEEEISSPNLPAFVENNEDFMHADAGIWEFGASDVTGIQEAWLGLKGLLYVQLEVEKMNLDGHSGYACIFPSAAYRLVWALDSLKAVDGSIKIDGFHTDVKPLSEADKKAIEKIDLHEDRIKEFYGMNEFMNGLTGDALKEAFYNAPTCNICGIKTGYQDEGSKTVIPARALAKLDFRLVVNQDPDDILKKLRKHLDKHGFSDVKIAWHEGYPAARTPIDHPFVEIVKRANVRSHGHAIHIHPTNPGSGPLYLFDRYVPMVSIGVADFYSRAHAPNESILVENFHLGMKRIAVIIDEMRNW
ncbi:MAG: M20/M25/M40 family metallo-hydrolase [Candidatus Lokiarchaeota archaeon]|nr:M20/M25/M40 family metallo-hydrolase [Candidatus Lokiarchaeota archaeon]